MSIALPPLPYAKDSLEPYISAQTLNFHYDKHHHAYIEKLNKAIRGTENDGKDLETLIADDPGRCLQQCGPVMESYVLLELTEIRRRR